MTTPRSGDITPTIDEAQASERGNLDDVVYDPFPPGSHSLHEIARIGLPHPAGQSQPPIRVPGHPPGHDGSELISVAPDPGGKRLGMNRARFTSQSGSSRRGARQSIQASSPTQPYQVSPNPITPDPIHAVPGGLLAYQGPTPQYQANSPSFEQSYRGQYTMPSQSPISMGHSPSPFPYNQPYVHHTGLRGPQESLVVSTGVHGGYQSMMQPHVYSYQRHSPENASSHPPYPQTQVTPPPPPISPMTGSAPGPLQGGPHTFSQPGQFHSLPYSSPISPPYVGYTSSPMYQSQFAPVSYAQNYAPTSTEAENPGTWWYMPHSGPPGSHQYDGGVPPHYPPHYQVGAYPQQMARREVDSSYTSSGPNMLISTAPVMSMTSVATRAPGQPASSQNIPPTSTPAIHEPSAQSPTGPEDPCTSPQSKLNARTPVRKPYHPNPPSNRSEWVMWAGNVPSDAVHDELWRFFKQPLSSSSTRSASPASGPSGTKPDPPIYDGVSSIFLISRSNCAFINFETEAHLLSAIERFNGKPLRPKDDRCPRLVCRVRRKDDDLKAGVGGQRGVGVHTRWVKEKMNKSDSETATPGASEVGPVLPSELGPIVAAMSLSQDDDRFKPRPKQSSSGSYASTNSSILTRYFPKRFFILKSLTQFDLDLSVEKGLWATQRHNEGILDQAFRTSSEVYLIFGVNKSGEFYGYAKMSGPVLQGEHRVSWASRTTDSSTSSRSSLSLSPAASRVTGDSTSPIRPLRQPNFLTPSENNMVVESPMPMSTPDNQRRQIATEQEFQAHKPRDMRSAPAVLGPSHRALTRETPKTKQSLGTDVLIGYEAKGHIDVDVQNLPDGFELDAEAPIRAIKNSSNVSQEQQSSSSGLRSEPLDIVAEEEEKFELDTQEPEGKQEPEAAREGWGESFKIDWICTKRLPFYKTRHLRNPWNHDREIKVSRDGTELEPDVGQALIEEWETLAAEAAVDVERGTTGAPKRGNTGRSEEPAH